MGGRIEFKATRPIFGGDEIVLRGKVAAREADLLDARRTYDLQMNTLRSLLTDDYSGFTFVVELWVEER